MTRSWMISLCVFAAAFLLSATGFAQQTVQIVNDNAPAKQDSDVWVLFVGNPANVTATASGVTKTISGMRNLSIPTGAVSTAQTAAATVVQSDTFKKSPPVLPTPPFPLQFISGANAGSQVQVTQYDLATGTFTVQKDPTLKAQARDDQFVLGAYSQKLSTLPISGTISSPLSGASRNVYTVTAQTLDAAVVYVSNGQLTYLATAPAISSSTIPFQTVELTTGTGGGATTSNLTVIDYFSIPLQIQSIKSDGSAADTRTFYFKSSTIATGLGKIGATLRNNAFYLGPGQVTRIPANNGNPSPFPSFKGYLQSLKTKVFHLDGTSNFGTPNPAVVYGITAGGSGTNPAGGYQSTYGYDAKLTEDSGGNFSVVMTPQPGQNSFTNAPPYFPSVSNIDNVTINLPAATSTDPVGYDAIIYGAVLDAGSFKINLKAGSPSLTPPTLSGPFSVTTGASTTQFKASALTQLATSKLGKLTVKFLSGTNVGQQASISSVDASGNVTLATALTGVPAANDSFQILFPVTSGTGNTSTFFRCTHLSELNFLATFSIMFEPGTANAGKTAEVVVIDSAGNVTLRWPTGVTPQPPADGDLFTVTVASDDIFTQLYTNSTFSWVVSQVLSGLNFGFPGSSTAGESSAGWYASFPQQHPFGLARATTDDGFYNPWAAYFYNASDAYGFAFSDRIAPSPLMSTNPATQNFRITVLPSTQIDAPLVKATATASQINLSWPAESGVTYTVTTLPVIPAGQISYPAAGTATLTSLPAGTPYQIFVKGTKGAQTSLVLPAYVNTTGSLTPTTGAAPFGAAFTWALVGGNVPSNYNVLLNGTQFSLSGPSSTANVALGGNAGNNLYVLDFQDTTQGNQSVYKAVMEANVTGVTSAKPTSFNLGGTPALYGSIGALIVAPSTRPYMITYPGGGTIGVSPLVLSINFNPQVRKEFAPVVTP